MNVLDQWTAAIRCPDCALVGVASLAKGNHSETKVVRLPEGFKAVTTESGDTIYCAACNRPARTITI